MSIFAMRELVYEIHTSLQLAMDDDEALVEVFIKFISAVVAIGLCVYIIIITFCKKNFKAK